MDRNGTALNTLMFIRMSSNIFYPFSTIYPEAGNFVFMEDVINYVILTF